jgi:hypothetical protein
MVEDVFQMQAQEKNSDWLMLLCDVCFFSDGANSACVGGKVATVHSQL